MLSDTQDYEIFRDMPNFCYKGRTIIMNSSSTEIQLLHSAISTMPIKLQCSSPVGGIRDYPVKSLFFLAATNCEGYGRVDTEIRVPSRRVFVPHWLLTATKNLTACVITVLFHPRCITVILCKIRAATCTVPSVIASHCSSIIVPSHLSFNLSDDIRVLDLLNLFTSKDISPTKLLYHHGREKGQ